MSAPRTRPTRQAVLPSPHAPFRRAATRRDHRGVPVANLKGPRIGSLCSGVGALDLAVADLLDASVAWHCQYDPDDPGQHAARVLAHHWPGVPNHGDIRAVDWAGVEPVDVVTAGFPCQSVSVAGPRTGLGPDAASGLWVHVASAIRALRPRLRMVVIENVPGLRWTRSDSPMEPCPTHVGDDEPVPALRALGTVLGDLADLGLDTEWTSLAASAVGAPHRRDRVFVLAWPQGRPPEHHPAHRTALRAGVVAHPDRLPLRP